jgi:hypothetical protein
MLANRMNDLFRKLLLETSLLHLTSLSQTARARGVWIYRDGVSNAATITYFLHYFQLSSTRYVSAMIHASNWSK